MNKVMDIKDVVKKGLCEFLKGLKHGYRKALGKRLSMGEVHDVMMEVINTWAPVINAELGMKGLPVGIERLVSDNNSNVNNAEAIQILGQCESVIKGSRHVKTPCVKPIAINLYVEAFTHLGYTDRNVLYQAVLFILAHEIRHSYQSSTGQMVSKQKHTFIRVLNMFSLELPYQHQWCELDANKWAKWFMDKHVHGVTTAYEEVPSDYETEDYFARAQEQFTQR